MTYDLLPESFRDYLEEKMKEKVKLSILPKASGGEGFVNCVRIRRTRCIP